MTIKMPPYEATKLSSEIHDTLEKDVMRVIRMLGETKGRPGFIVKDEWAPDGQSVRVSVENHMATAQGMDALEKLMNDANIKFDKVQHSARRTTYDLPITVSNAMQFKLDNFGAALSREVLSDDPTPGGRKGASSLVRR